jgi:hypothetical protein
MKKNILSIILAGGFLLPLDTHAQSTTYISNLGQSSVSSVAIGSDSWLALSFSTGTNTSGYQLNSIQLGMINATGNPSGFSFRLYSAIGAGVSVGSSLGTLNGSLNPTAGGTFTYIPTSILTLLPNTFYFVVLTAGTSIANGAYEWADSDARPVNYNSIGGWRAPVSLGAVENYQSSNGSNWSYFNGAPEFAINATTVPEPEACVLFGLSALSLFGFRSFTVRAKVCSCVSRRIGPSLTKPVFRSTTVTTHALPRP